MSNKQSSSAFISHSSQDDRYVMELEHLLRSCGFTDIFNDGHTIQPDEEFWKKIEQGILACDGFYVVLSKDSVKSTWVNREAEFARANQKTVIGVLIDDCELPASFVDRDVIDLRPGRGSRFKLAPSRILRHSPDELFGREKWLDALDEAWRDRKGVNVYTLVAWGGVGKTSLVAHWVAHRLMKFGWPGVERYFDWSFYSQGTGDSRQTSADLFIAAALKFFGDPDPTLGSPWERGERLAGLVRQHRTLLVLDGIEPLQYPPNDPQAGRLKDQALEALLQSLAAENPGLCVVTTREHLKNIESLPTTREEKLDKLIKEAAISLLRHLQIVGTDEELADAWRDAGGHALTLQLLGRYIADAYPNQPDIRHYKEVNFEEADLETQGRSAFKVMIAYERWLQSAGPERQRELAILRLTGLFDRPISPDCLQALRAEPAISGLTDALVSLTDPQWNIGLKRLLEIDLLSQPESEDSLPGEYNPASAIDAHPLIREYFADQLKRNSPEAFRAGHSRLFDHLCEHTEHQPDDLPGLQPLYQAVVHGCLAERQQEAREKVYRDRILRGTGSGGNYSTNILGAMGANLGAVTAFFEIPWSRLSPNLSQPDQAWLLNEAAFSLRALGRLTEALGPMRIGMGRRVKTEDWRNTAISASNLSQLELTLGQLNDAVADGRRSVDFADRSEDKFLRMAFRTTAADALHQFGQRPEAEALFAEAERMQVERQPELPLLYSVQGFRYVDLLLAPAERAVWKLCGTQVSDGSQEVPSESLPADETHQFEALAACDEANRRGAKLIQWRLPSDPLLDIGLDHLTLARSALYHALLTGTVPETLPEMVTTALSKVREANTLDHLPRALLTAAFYYGTVGKQPEEAKRYLNEAQLIAERGPMPLYLADAYLHRARLFRDREALAQARVLIEKHAYHRRDEELAAAETALCHE